MEKNFLKDVIPPAHKKSIRDIPLPKNSINKTNGANRSRAKTRTVKDGDFSRKSRSKMPTIVKLIIILIIGYIGYSVIFSKASVTLTPHKIDSAQVDLSYIVYNKVTPPENTPQTYIPYILTDISVESSKEIPATGEENVEDFASGTIKIFNNYSTETQRLINKTRFESTDGNIYRVRHSVNVPGKSSDGTPGSIEVQIYADEPGEDYNMESGTFVIPGLKGTDQYDGMYAETTTALTGGFIGLKKVVTEDDEENAREELRSDLEKSLVSKIDSTISEDKIFYYSPNFIEYVSLPSEVNGDSVVIKEKGMLVGLLFDRSEITSNVVRDSVKAADGTEPIQISNIDELVITLLEGEEFDPNTDNEGTLSIKGNPVFEWQLDEMAIQDLFTGVKKSEVKDIVRNIDGISNVSHSIRPFWKGSFPTDPEKINIIINSEISVDEE